MKYLYIILFSLLGFGSFKAQDILETDTLPSRFILFLPTATDTKLELIKSEFLKYPQILSATYIYKDHHALLIELGEVINTQFIVYADIIKVVAVGVKYDEIKIKTPTVYDQIISDAEGNATTFILK